MPPCGGSCCRQTHMNLLHILPPQSEMARTKQKSHGQAPNDGRQEPQRTDSRQMTEGERNMGDHKEINPHELGCPAICRPDFNKQPPDFRCRQLAAMWRHNGGLTRGVLQPVQHHSLPPAMPWRMAQGVRQAVCEGLADGEGRLHPTPNAKDAWLCPTCLGAVEDFKQCAKVTAVRCRPMVAAITTHMPPHGGGKIKCRHVKMPPCAMWRQSIIAAMWRHFPIVVCRRMATHRPH